jgi:hypothetical protein
VRGELGALEVVSLGVSSFGWSWERRHVIVEWRVCGIRRAETRLSGLGGIEARLWDGKRVFAVGGNGVGVRFARSGLEVGVGVGVTVSRNGRLVGDGGVVDDGTDAWVGVLDGLILE